MNDLHVGDRVKLSDGTKEGAVLGPSYGSWFYTVKWDNGDQTSLHRELLILIAEYDYDDFEDKIKDRIG